MKNKNSIKVNGKKGLGTSNGEQVWPGREPRGPQPGPGRHPATVEHAHTSYHPKQQIRLTFASWNVRTLLDLDNSNRPERRTALVSKELARYNIDLAALSETRFSDEGQLLETSGYTFFWKGLPEGERRVAGVGFAIKSSLVEYLNEVPTGLSERIISCRLALTNNRFAKIISVYAPTLSHAPEETDQFYADLGKVVRDTPIGDKIAIMGDFNARVGSDFNTWPALGRHGSGKCNRNGPSYFLY